jgi:hypothetical protein
VPGQGKECPVVGWRDPLQPVHRTETVSFYGCLGARMRRKQRGSPSLLNSSRIVRSRSGPSVFSGRWMLIRLGAELRDDLPCRVLIEQHAERRLDDRVTG